MLLEFQDFLSTNLVVAPPGATSMEQLLASQTLILQQLVTQRQQSSDPLSALLGSAEEVPKSASVKGIAARQLLVEHFQKRPDRVVQTIKERLATARRKTSPKDLLPGDLWQHFAEAVPLGNHRTLTYVGFIAAKMWEHAERQEHVQLHALVGLLAVFVEQATYDGGGLKLAHLLTGLEEPPFQITELHKAPRTDLHAHGQLSDPRWLATHLAYLRDLDTIRRASMVAQQRLQIQRFFQIPSQSQNGSQRREVSKTKTIRPKGEKFYEPGCCCSFEA